MALLAGAWRHLLFRLLLARLSDSWTHGAGRNFAGGRISSSRGTFVWPSPRPVVCSNLILACERTSHAGGGVLGWHGRIAAVGYEFLAARNAGDLFCMLSLVRECGAGFFGISIGWDAAGSGVHRPFLCSCRIPSGAGRVVSAVPRQPVSVAVGMVSHLLRIGRCKD